MESKVGNVTINRGTAKKILQQLDRILGSAAFRQVHRLKRFLRFIVTEAVEGRHDKLKEYVVGVQVFGKEDSFDPRTDPVVRVQARRLRARLVRYYEEEGRADELVVELPKGGYAPQFVLRSPAATQRRPVGAALANRNILAVLPFADHSIEQNLEHLSRGIREEIVHCVAEIPTLRLLAWDTSDPGAAVRRGDTPFPTHAAAVITGSLRRSGDHVRVTTQMIDAASGCYLWSESLDARLDNTFETQERVARSVLKRIKSELLDSGDLRAVQRPTPNLAAHNLWLQGCYHLSQRTEEALLKAVEFFERALVEDPDYSLPHSGLSDAYGLLSHYGAWGPAEVWTKAAASAATAVLLDGNSPEAHTSFAHVKSTQDWDWAAAEKEFLRAISLGPRYPTAHHWYATSCLAPMGRLDEALEQMCLAESLDPVSSIIARDVAVMYYYKRNFDAALEQCDHTIELNPHFAPAYHTLGLVQEQRGELDESIAALQRAANLSPLSPRMRAAFGRINALTGNRKVALDTIGDLEELARNRYVAPFDFASIYIALRRLDQGFTWLVRACEDRCFDMLFINVDPRFDPVRRDRRFAPIEKSLGLG